MWKFISEIILKHRLFIVLIIMILTVFMFQKAKQVKLSYMMPKLLPENHEAMLDHEDFINKYGNQNIFIVAIEDSQLTSHFKALDMLTNQINNIYGVEQVISITNLPVLTKDTIRKQFLTAKWLNSTIDNQQEKAINKFLKEPFYKNRLTNSDNTVTALLISLSDTIIKSANREELIFSIKDIIDNYSKQYNVTTYFSGLPYLRTIDSIMVRGEILMFVLLALIITSLILYLFFRSFKATISSIIVVVIGVVFSFGSIVLLGYEISIFMALVAPVIIVIGIPNCIFLINKYHSEFIKTNNKEYALKIMIQKIGNITLLTNLTTASGFASFILTNSKTLQEFGVIASLNIILIFLLSLIIIPIYFSFASEPQKKHTQHLNKKWIKSLVSHLVFLVQNKRKHIYFTTILLLIIGFFGLIKVKNNSNLTDDLPKDQALYKDLKFLEYNFGGVMPLEVLVDTKKKNGLFKSYNLKKIEQFSSLLETYPEFSKPSSYIDVIKYTKQTFYNGDTTYYSLPNSYEKKIIMEYFHNSNDSLKFGGLIMDPFKREARISLRIADVSTLKMDSIFESIIPQINKIFDPEKYNITITGTSIVFLNGAKLLLKNLVLSLLLVIVLISVFMAWMFNSFRMVIISIIPNLIPLLLTAAIMGFVGIPLKPSTILVFSIAFGISVDDTIHFLAKYRQELLENNWNMRKSVLSSLKETGISMFYTSVVLFFGFFIFVASDFGGTIALGVLVSITLMIAMLANLLLVPSLLLSLEKVINYKAFQDP